MSRLILKPDDFHLHLRDEPYLSDTAPAAADQFRYAIIMPNLQPPITTTDMAVQYRNRILNSVKGKQGNSTFKPLMTLYLTPQTTAEDIEIAKSSGIVFGVKLYPAGATTHSSAGVSMTNSGTLKLLHPVFSRMSELSFPLLIHGEATDPSVDIFEREATFINNFLPIITTAHPKLRIVLEHITTNTAVEYIKSAPDNIAATITIQHLICNRNSLFTPSLNPHNYCMPILKEEKDRLSLLSAATSGHKRFFAGTDSAPHSSTRKVKEGCAGCYTAYAAIELYAQIFDSVGEIDKLEDFLSLNGSRWYGLEDESRPKVEIIKEDWVIPLSLSFGPDQVIPFMAGQICKWKRIRKDEQE